LISTEVTEALERISIPLESARMSFDLAKTSRI
jgi:hypothetical protein